MLVDWLNSERAIDCLEPSELETLQQASHTDKQLNELSWMQEALCVLRWCGNLVDELPRPDEECDLTSAFASIPPENHCGIFRNSCSA